MLSISNVVIGQSVTGKLDGKQREFFYKEEVKYYSLCS